MLRLELKEEDQKGESLKNKNKMHPLGPKIMTINESKGPKKPSIL